MSEEIKKEAQDVELNPEELDKVAGGEISMELIGKRADGYWYVANCPYCSYNIEFHATSSFNEIENLMMQHIQLYHPTGETWDDPI